MASHSNIITSRRLSVACDMRRFVDKVFMECNCMASGDTAQGKFLEGDLENLLAGLRLFYCTA